MLQKTQFACDTAKQHAENIPETALNGPLLKSYLATYCAYLFCSEMEEQLSSILQQKLNEVMVGRIALFVLNTNRGMIKRVNKSDISKFMESFGPEAKREFNEIFSDSEIQKYSNIVTARHTQAHTSGIVSITLDEVAEGIQVANRILDQVAALISKN